MGVYIKLCTITTYLWTEHISAFCTLLACNVFKERAKQAEILDGVEQIAQSGKKKKWHVERLVDSFKKAS